MQTRQELLDTLSLREIKNAVADRLFADLKVEAIDMGADISDYDASSLEDSVDDFGRNVSRRLSQLFGEL